MKLRLKHCEVELHFLFAAAVTLMLILDADGIVSLGVASCLAHECGHLICLLLFGEQPRRIVLGAFGMRIERTGAVRLSLTQECIAALSGPAVNLLLAAICILFRQPDIPAFQKAALVNLGIALFNLLPIEQLDGGHALYYLLSASRRIGEERARRICGRISLIVLIPLICLGVALIVRSGYNFTLLLVGIYLFLLFWVKE
ncbi:MAG: site-2 protease family protein [Oscillospiraceae bacterium]|jgi:stage IV sporulation protein FB|nr:site-2 protease family protein [Oscillospiraceae bacterium]